MSTPNLSRRMRRLYHSGLMRQFVREFNFNIGDLIHPIFIEESLTESLEISTMLGIQCISEHTLAQAITERHKLSIQYVMPFHISQYKDSVRGDTWHNEGLRPRMIKTIKHAPR